MIKYLSLVVLTVACSVEPIDLEVVETYHNLTELVVDEGSRYTVVSHNEMVESREGHVLIKHLNGTLLSEADLGHQPDELHARSLNDRIHIAAVSHAERSSLDRVSYCRYYPTRDPGLICRARQSFSPPTKFVVSRLFDENNMKLWVIYFDQFGYMVRDLTAETDEPLELPANCTCSNFSNCLKQHDEPNGRVMLRCDSGTSHLYDLNSQFPYYVSTPNVKQLATTSYRDMIIAVQRAEGKFQDILVETNMVMHLEDVAVQPLPGVLGYSSDPATIQGVAILAVNETSQLEVCVFIQNNVILYFEVVDLGIVPKIRHLPLPADLTPIAIRGIFSSSIAVEAIYSNGSLVVMIIEFLASQSRADPLDSNTGSNSPPLSTNNPTSCTPQGHNVTEPPGSRTTEEPEPHDASDKPQTTNTTDDSATRDFSHSFVVTIAIVTFFVGVFVTLVVVVLVMLLCRLRKSRGYDIGMAERNS